MADGVVEYIVRLTDKTKTGTRSAVQGSERLEKQTRDTTRAVDKLGDESAQTGRQLDRMGKEGKQASAGMAGLARGMSGALSSVSGLTAGVGGLVATLGIGALVGTLTAATRAVFQFGQEVADLRNDISDASTRSGIAADTLQGLRLAAEGAGLSFGSITSTLDQFGRRMATAKGATNATAEAFAALGVEVEDAATGGLRDGDAVLRETLAALNAMEPTAERTALATETLGRSGARLLQALSGSELEDFVALAREFGVDVGPKGAESAGRWQRASAELTTVLDGLKAEIFDLIGGAETLFEFTETILIAFAGLKGAIGGLAEGFDSATDRIVKPIEKLIEAVSLLIEGLERLSRGDLSGSLESLTASLGAVQTAAISTPAAIASSITAGIPEALLTAGFRGAEAADTEGAASAARLRELRVGTPATPTTTPSTEDDEDDEDDENGSRTTSTASTERSRQMSREETRAVMADIADIVAGGVQQVGRAGSVGAATPDAERANQEFLNRMVAETEAARLKRFETAQTAIGVTGQVLGGDLGGGLSSVAGARGMPGLGVAGAAVSGLQFIGEQGADGIRDTLDGVKDGLIAALRALPELIGDILPEFAISLVSELIPALIEAAPEIFKSLLIDLPVAIADALASLIGVESRTGKGALRGAGIGAIIGGAVLGLPTFGLGVSAGAAIGAGAGGAIGATVTAGRRNARDRGTARTASAGQMSTARESDRLAAMSTRSRARARSVQGNPFDALAAQFDAQFGTYGRATSTTIGVPA